MFRIGSMLFIPAYLTLPLLRAFASADKDGGFVVMTREPLLNRGIWQLAHAFLVAVLTINMACRYAGGTFAYTSVMVLINASEWSSETWPLQPLTSTSQCHLPKSSAYQTVWRKVSSLLGASSVRSLVVR